MPTQALLTTSELNEINHKVISSLDELTLKTLQKNTEELIKSKIAEQALKEGDKVKNFALTNSKNEEIKFTDLLSKNKPIVMTFYRGNWCPYCNAELRGFQRELPEMKALGAEVIAISPQKPVMSLEMQEQHQLDFDVLSDVGNLVAKDFGLVFKLDAELLDLYINKFHLQLFFSSKNTIPKTSFIFWFIFIITTVTISIAATIAISTTITVTITTTISTFTMLYSI